MSIADRFKGMNKAEVKGSRLPSPALGKAAFLVNAIRMHDNRDKVGFRVEVSMTCLWPIEKGKTHDNKEVEPNRPGDKVSVCIFSGDYFQKSFKDMCLKACGKEPHEELDIVAVISQMPEYTSLFAGKTELEQLEILWEKVLPGLVCAFDADGKATTSGVFDGQVVLEVGSTEKLIHTLVDKTKPDTEANWMFDRAGNPITKLFSNSFFNRKISMEEVGEKLDEAAIVKFFGSTENFMEILNNDK